MNPDIPGGTPADGRSRSGGAEPGSAGSRGAATPGAAFRGWSRPGRLFLGALYLGLALTLVQLHAFMVNFGDDAHKRAHRHEQILEWQGESPWAYRLAVPAMAEGLSRVPRLAGHPARSSVEYGYLALRLVFTLGVLLAFHAWLEHWLDPPGALSGTLLLAALHGPAYAWYWFQPASEADLLLWLLAALAARSEGWRWLLPAVALGALNRETSVFMVLIYGAASLDRLPLATVLRRCAALFAVWAAIFVGLRVLVPTSGWVHGSTPLGMLRANLRHPGWLLYAITFFGLLWFVPAWSWDRAPRPLRALTVTLGPYLALQLLFGRIREVRLLLPLSLVLVPLGLRELNRLRHDPPLRELPSREDPP